MIVQCAACQSKFRVPDDKIGDKPVKVRCSKCANVFAVTRAQALPEPSTPAGAPAAPAPARPKSGANLASPGKTGGALPPARPPPPVDPFAAFGQAQAPVGEVTSPGVYHAGIAASRTPEQRDETKPGLALSQLVASKVGGGTVDHLQPPPSPVQPNEFKAPPDPFASLDLSALGGPKASAPASESDPFAQLDLGAPAPPQAPPASESDPFAKLDLGLPGSRTTQETVPRARMEDLIAQSRRPDQPKPHGGALQPAPAPDPFAGLSLNSPSGLPPPPAPPTESDPFAKLELSGPLARPAAPAASSSPFGSPNSVLGGPTGPALKAAPAAPAADPFASLDLSGGLRPPAPPPPSESDPFAKLELASPAPSKPTSDPFANMQLQAPAPLDPANLPPATESDPKFRPDLRSAAKLPAAPVSAATPAGAPAPALPDDPFANLDMGAMTAKPGAKAAPAPKADAGVSFSFEGKGAAPVSASAPRGAEAKPQSSAAPDDFFDNLPGTPNAPPKPEAPAAPGMDDFFGAHAEAKEHAESHAPHADASHSAPPDRSMFDLPDKPPPATTAAHAPAAGSEPLELVGEKKPVEAKKAAPVRVAAPVAPPGQRAVAAVLNLLLVGAVAWGSLLVYATSKRAWRFDPALLRPAELGRAVLGAKTGPLADLSLEGVTNGFYQTATGRQVFYVRGRIANQGAAALGPVQVKVEVLDGDKALTQAVGWAGKGVSPEALHGLTDYNSLTPLVAQQKADAEPVPAGGAKPFVVVLMDYPEDLASRGLRVTPELPEPVAQK